MSIPAGWYPESSGSVTERWWDGNAWTEQTRPAATPPPPLPAATSTSTPWVNDHPAANKSAMKRSFRESKEIKAMEAGGLSYAQFQAQAKSPKPTKTMPAKPPIVDADRSPAIGSGPTLPPTKVKKHRIRNILLTGAVLFVLLIVIISIAVSSGGHPASLAASTTTSAPSHTSKAATVPPSTISTPSVAPATVAPVQAPTVKTQKFAGTGDDVQAIALNDQPGIITFSCPACTANTVLQTDGAESLLVNAIGPYSGSHIVNTADGSVTTKLTVKADAAWTLTVAGIDSVKPKAGKISGHGDEVIMMAGNTTQAAVTNLSSAGGNFVVTGYGGSSPELAVNEIGSYKGTVSLTGPGFVQVISDGNWTIDPS